MAVKTTVPAVQGLTSTDGTSAAATRAATTINPSTIRVNVFEPYFDNDRGAWGFWFLGQWMGL